MLGKHSRQMECGRIYQFFHIQHIFFHIQAFFNIPQKSRTTLWKHCGNWKVEEYMNCFTLHIHVVIKSIFRHSWEGL